MSKKYVKPIVYTLAVAVLAVLGVFGCKFVRQEMDKAEIRAFWEGRDDTGRFYVGTGYTAPEAYIAHGGGILDFVYSNSREAVQDSLQRGFRFIELDLLVTSDGHIVGAHAWDELRGQAGMPPQPGEPLSYDEVKGIKVNGLYTPLEGKEIADIMRANPDLVLVTDNIREFELLMRELPFPERMIVETRSVEDYLAAIRAGVKYPAYNVCRGRNLKLAKKYGFPIVIMDAAYLADAGLVETVQQLHDSGVTIFLYNADYDTPGFLKQHLGKSASKIYTNHWAPSALPCP